ncbi:glutathione S-transferase family protein [Acinetobacter larvae]|uniref:Glutathione S-transferase n=1 Tax=Acinetobacter larvae TaxID=1789224 RepID=A0A1B2M394_9GAMM|nr:glutathione S-transferase family protein [Acinetobacter larvae]AOA59667.1 glutathione S-transferase [Acinetobacter larvae]
MLELYIGNKNYSSWSLRAWLVLKTAAIPFYEHMVFFDDFQKQSPFKQKILALSSVGKVPILKHKDLIITDSLAICEYLAECYPDRLLWPKDPAQRAYARSITAEMHSGFNVFRQYFPMNIEAELGELGAKYCQDNAALQQELDRMQAIWSSRPTRDGFLCGPQFGIADAFYAPMVLRCLSYAVPLSEDAQAYVQQVLTVPALQQWIKEAKQEHRFVEINEPYRRRI